MDGKECKNCRKFKPLSDYYTRADMADGYMRQCKACKSSTVAATIRAKKGKPVEVEDCNGWPMAAPPEPDEHSLTYTLRQSWGGVTRGPLFAAVL